MIIVHASWHDPVEVKTSEREMDKRSGITGPWQNAPEVPGVYAFLKQDGGAGAKSKLPRQERGALLNSDWAQ